MAGLATQPYGSTFPVLSSSLHQLRIHRLLSFSSLSSSLLLNTFLTSNLFFFFILSLLSLVYSNVPFIIPNYFILIAIRPPFAHHFHSKLTRKSATQLGDTSSTTAPSTNFQFQQLPTTNPHRASHPSPFPPCPPTPSTTPPSFRPYRPNNGTIPHPSPSALPNPLLSPPSHNSHPPRPPIPNSNPAISAPHNIKEIHNATHPLRVRLLCHPCHIALHLLPSPVENAQEARGNAEQTGRFYGDWRTQRRQGSGTSQAQYCKERGCWVCREASG